MFSLPTLTLDEAKKAWDLNIKGNQTELQNIKAIYVGEGKHLSDVEIEPLKDRFEEIKNKIGDKGKDRAAHLESQLVPVIHEFMDDKSDLANVTNPGFWLWISNRALDGYFWNYIRWRYHPTNPTEIPDKMNFSFQVRQSEGLLYRCWLRGQMLCGQGSKDKYNNAMRGNVDFWRSHVFRTNIGSNPQMILAMLDLIFPEPGYRLNQKELSTTRIRNIAKQLQARLATEQFFHLNKAQCAKIVNEVFMAPPL